jgi:hypothetical protein
MLYRGSPVDLKKRKNNFRLPSAKEYGPEGVLPGHIEASLHPARLYASLVVHEQRQQKNNRKRDSDQPQ